MYIRMFHLMVIALLFAGCRTTTNSSTRLSAKTVAEPLVGNARVVQPSGGRSTVLTEIAPETWVSMKAGSPSEQMHAHLFARRYEEAEKSAREILSREPRNLEALLVLTNALVATRQFELASWYADVLERWWPERSESLNIRALATLGTADNRLARWMRAAELFRMALVRSPDEVAAALNLGSLHLWMGDDQAALSAFKDASKRCGGCAVAQIGTANALAQGAQSLPAKDILERVLSSDGSNLEAMFRLAVLYNIGFGDQKKAEETLVKLMSRTSSTTEEWSRANSYLKTMRMESPPARPAS
jgi:thioredoxin-like negative regulator of GroEL